MTTSATDTNSLAGRVSENSARIASKSGAATTAKALSDANIESTSGIKAGGYKSPDIAEYTRAVLRTEQHVTEKEGIIKKEIVIRNRINSAARANDDLMKIAQNFHTRITSAQQPGTEDRTFNKFCESSLNEVQIILNRRDAQGRSLFGGSATQTNPVDLSLATVPGAGAIPDDTYNAYFQGEESIHSTTIGGEELQYGFHALEPGVRDLIFYLKSGTIVTPDHTPGSVNTTRLQGMQDGMHKVTENLADTKEIVGQQAAKLERFGEDAKDQLMAYEKELAEYIHADPMEAWVKRTEAANKQQLLQTLLAQDTRRLKDLLSTI